jgi:hypothetical protein
MGRQHLPFLPVEMIRMSDRCQNELTEIRFAAEFKATGSEIYHGNKPEGADEHH